MMRWNQILTEKARELDTAQLRSLIADPEVTPNGRAILQAELDGRLETLRRPA